jgi:predicted ferric reductase
MQHPANSLLWLLALIPTGIFLLTTSADHWQSAAGALHTLGRLSGIAGLSFLLVAAMLSSRVPGFDRLFGGLTKLWRTHHQLAAVSFLLLLAHPLFLAFSAATISVEASVRTFFPASWTLAVATGWLALIAMMIFLAPSFSFFGNPHYQRWKLLHKLAGLAVILALWHAFLLAQTIHHPWDYLLWGIYAALAVAAVIYRWVFSRQLISKKGRVKYRVAEVTYPLHGIAEIELAPEKQTLQYLPGQFVYLTPYDKQLPAGYAQEHPYTLSSAPHEANLRIAIKDLGDASRALQTIQVGSEVRVEGPYGAFFPVVENEDSELWIAGGIGITPFLSRARNLVKTQDEVDIYLILCVQDEARALFCRELEAIAANLPGFNVTTHYFYREGPLSEKFVIDHCPNFRSRSCYVCGPPTMLNHVQKFLRAAGVPPRQIHTEEFTLL